jgi:Major Facilitator Superfamily
VEVFTKHRRTFLVAVGLKASEIAYFIVATVFSISYVTGRLGMPRNVVLNGILLAAFVELFTMPAFGWLSDRFGRRPLFVAGCVFGILFAFPMFSLFKTLNPVVIAITIAAAISFGHGTIFGPEAVFPQSHAAICIWENVRKPSKRWKKRTRCGTPFLFSGSPFMKSSTPCAQIRAFKKCSTALVCRDSPACLRAPPICKNARHHLVCLPHAIAQCIGTSSEWPNHRRYR